MEVPEESSPRAGEAAPDFELPSTHGSKVRLSDYKGKNVVLYFYPKDDTPGCTREACSFRDNLPRFEKLNAVVLGVSKDSLASHQKFIEKHGLNFILLSDEDLVAHNLYSTWREKNNYGRKYWGTERSTFIVGRDGRVEKVFRKVKVDGHEEELLQSLSPKG